jgi:hypothetical protein
MTTLTLTHKSDSLWMRIKAAVAKASADRRERAIALWCGDNPLAGRGRADAAYRLMRSAYGSNAHR